MDREEALRRQFVREARIGVTLIGATLAVFVVVAYYKMSGRFSSTMELGSAANLTASTLNPQLQRTHATNATVAAIQAATRSVVDQVEPQRGDTSPTQAPPMPIPKVFNESSIPASELPEKDSEPADDPSAQITGRKSDTNMPLVAPAEVSENRRNFTPTPLVPETIDDKQDFSTAVTRNHNARIPVSAPMRSTIRQVHSNEPNSVLNRPIPAVRVDSEVDIPVGNRRIEAVGNATDSFGPTAESEMVVRLAPNESLWAVAQKQYGDGQYFRALAAYNGFNKTTSAQPTIGSEIRLPSLERLRAEFPALMPNELGPSGTGDPDVHNDLLAAKTYVTAVNETLFGIARDQLGQASRYVEIIELNANQLPDGVTSNTKLPAGVRLVLTHK